MILEPNVAELARDADADWHMANVAYPTNPLAEALLAWIARAVEAEKIVANYFEPRK